MLDWLYGLQGIGVKLGLENMRRLIDTLPSPTNPPLTLHVSGTNGKGSVCAFLDSVARAHGLKTGLFTSPHLVRYHERIRVNGTTIPVDRLDHWLAHLRDTIADWDPHPSFFEVTLALALAHFYEEEIECLVLETGLGGRLDATNALEHKDVAVVTPIHYDHTRILGDSLNLIAREKAGIFRQEVPVVSAAQELEAEIALREAAATLHAPISFIQTSYTGALKLPGTHQRANAALAAAAFHATGHPVSQEALEAGLSQAEWPGRFQQIGDHVIDGAHNIASIIALVDTWQETFGSEEASVIFGCAREKQAEEILAVLKPIACEFIFTPIRSHRSESPEHLASLPNLGQTRVAEDFEEALHLAADPNRNRKIIITGSLFLAGEAVAKLAGEAQPELTDQ